MELSRFIITVLLFIYVNDHVFSQNLVLNPSFELSIPKCNLIQNRDTFAASIQYWTRPTSGTSDIYNTLSNPNCVLYMPHAYTTGLNLEGPHTPRTGDFMAGLIPYGKRWPGNYPPGYPPVYREYLEVPLIQPLEVGKTYCASMYVVNSKTQQYGSNNLGMYFSDTLIDLDYHTALLFPSQVNEPTIIKDTVNWTKISGCFVATSPSRYLLIGNFKPDSASVFKFTHFTKHAYSMNYWYSYYLIDDVSVEEYIDVSLDASNDTSICLNTKTVLKAAGPDYIWWSYENEQDTLGIGNEIILTLDTTIKVVAHGKNCSCNEYTDTIQINVFAHEIFEIGNDTILCLSDEIEIDIDNTLFISPVWNINFSDPYHVNISEIGTYNVSVSDFNNCLYSDTFSILDIISPPATDIKDEVFICEEKYSVSLPKFKGEYLWSDGDQTNFKTFRKTGTYILVSSNICGVDYDTITIKDKSDFFAPNLVTLNGDGKNDHLVFTGLPSNLYGYLEVYNRWGDRVYEESQYKNDWPYEDIHEGVYYYYFQYDGCIKLKGWVEIIR